MQSDAKVPDPAPRGLSVPAGAVVVLVLTGAIWGVGLFLLGRQTAPPVEVLDRAGASHLASLNRIDQALVKGDETEVTVQIANAVLPDDPLGRTALELRRARVTELAVARKAREAEEAAKRAAAAPEAVLKRLQGNLWRLFGGGDRIGKMAFQPLVAVDVPIVEKPASEVEPPESAPRPSQAPPQDPPKPALAELTLAGERFVPDAQIMHPTIARRSYALHPAKGLLRSDDGGTTWRVGLQPLQELLGYQVSFTSGERPLLIVLDRKGATWLFNDAEDAFFP
jgi:hypothetical protein